MTFVLGDLLVPPWVPPSTRPDKCSFPRGSPHECQQAGKGRNRLLDTACAILPCHAMSAHTLQRFLGTSRAGRARLARGHKCDRLCAWLAQWLHPSGAGSKGPNPLHGLGYVAEMFRCRFRQRHTTCRVQNAVGPVCRYHDIGTSLPQRRCLGLWKLRCASKRRASFVFRHGHRSSGA